MAKTIEQRVGEAFDTRDKEDVVKYLDWLRESLSAAASIVRRSITLLLLLMVVFQLLQSRTATEISLGPIKLTQISAILYFIPTLIAYFYLETLIYTARFSRLDDAFRATFMKWNSKAEANDMDVLVTPWFPLYWSIESGGRPAHQPPDQKIESMIGTALGVASLLGGLVFEVYAYYRLFRIYPVTNPLLWINLVATAAMIVATVTFFVKYLRHEE